MQCLLDLMVGGSAKLSPTIWYAVCRFFSYFTSVPHWLNITILIITMPVNLELSFLMQHMRPAKLVASYDMKKIVSLLYEYGVDVSQYAVKHPEILQCQGKC